MKDVWATPKNKGIYLTKDIRKLSYIYIGHYVREEEEDEEEPCFDSCYLNSYDSDFKRVFTIL